MNDPHRDAGAATFTASHDGACDDVQLLRRISQGDEDTMLAVWRGAGSFRGESSVRSWVIAIARRQTRDRLRRRRLRVVDDAFLADQPGPGPGPEVLALDRAELAEVGAAIRELAAS